MEEPTAEELEQEEQRQRAEAKERKLQKAVNVLWFIATISMVVSNPNLMVALIALSVIIMAHEYGHALTAVKLGRKLVVFQIGMGIPFFSVYRGGTRYSLGSLPIGGFVRIQEPEVKRARDESLIALAGPVFSFAIGFVLLVISLTVVGTQSQLDIPRIGKVLPGPAQGLLYSGDYVLSYNQKPMKTWTDLLEAVQTRKDGESSTLLIRDVEGVQRVIKIPPPHNARKWRLGILGPVGPVKHKSFLEALKLSAQSVYATIAIPFQLLASSQGRTTLKGGVAGPVGIVDAITSSIQGNPRELPIVLGLISLAIGFMNLIPILPLDGGRIVLALLGAATRHKFDERLEAWGYSTGVALILLLFVFTLWQDISRILFR